jgi:WD40 repeat protein
MGIVYLAEQRAPIRRRVALKVLKRGDDRPSFIARFESERQALAMMDHPNIARVHDAGATEDGRPYFAMEYVPGIPITEYCDRNLLRFRERLLLFQQVCQAVQHAHQKGIIHRDLKPSNVLVTLQDGKPVPKVIDFGVAKAVNQQLTEKTLFTETGMLIGTPEYMSPEQADLTGLDVDTTTDVYSLGVLLYELLVGALPFDVKTLRRAGYAEIQRIIREEEPPRPTTRLSSMGATAQEVARRRRSDVRTLMRLLRGDLEWITMKALEKDRTRRYASASEFANDLGRHLANEPVSASPPSFKYRLGKMVRRHRGKFVAAAAVALTVLVGLVTSTILYIRADRQRAAAEWEAYKASLAAAQSDIEIARVEDARARLRTVPQRLRGWEWNYLYWRSDRSLVTLYTGEYRSSAVGFSSDGSHLYVSGHVAVHSWETRTFRRSADYGPFRPIVTMTRDGARLACWADRSGRSIQIMETFTGKMVAILNGHRTRIVEAVFDGDGGKLATRSEDDEIRVWATNSGRTLLTIQASTPEKRRGGGIGHELIAFTRDGRRLASSAYGGIVLWNAVDGRALAEWRADEGPIQSLAFNEDGTRLFSAGSGIRVWDGLSGRILTVLNQNVSGGFLLAAESPDGSQWADITWHKELHIWNSASSELHATLNGIRGAVSALVYSPDGKYLVAANSRGEVRVWDAPRVGGLFLKFAHSSWYRSQDLGTDGKRLAVADGPNVEVLDTQTGAILHSWRDRNEPVGVVAYQPAGKAVASGADDGTICVWYPGSAAPRLRIRAHTGPVSALTFSLDGRQLVSASGTVWVSMPSNDRTVRFWDVETGKNRITRELGTGIRSLAFSPDGKTVLAGFQDGVLIRRMDGLTGADLPSLEAVSTMRRAVSNLAFDRTGSRIAAGPIWNASTGKAMLQLADTDMSTPSYSFTPDGSRVFGSFNDSTMSIWQAKNGERILRLYFQRTGKLQFTPEGTTLYGNAIDSIRIYGTTATIPPEADELYEHLTRRFPLFCDMRDFLERDREVDPKLRDVLLRMIESRPEDADTVFRMVDSVINSPISEPHAYQTALQRSRRIADISPWDGAALGRVGAAQYRAGDFSGTVTTLEQAAKIQQTPGARTSLFLAMAHHRLGHPAEAGQHLDHARELIVKLIGREDVIAPLRVLLREAESLMASPAPK